MGRSGRVRRVRATPVGVRPPTRREIRDVRHSSAPALRIERVVVAPSGVHVVTQGTGPLDESHEHDRDRARSAGDVVRAVLPPRYRGRVRSVLCHPDEADARTTAGVLVTSPATLEHIVQWAPVVLSTSEVHEVELRLGATLTPFPVPSPAANRTRWRRRLAVAGLVAASAAGAAGAAAALVMPETALPLPGW